jgi:hypothetical protein
VNEYVLTLRADSDAPGDGAPITLLKVGNPEPIATHPRGFDTSPFVKNGKEIDLASCLTAEGLLNNARNQFVGTTLWERIVPRDIGTNLRPHVAGSRVYLDLRSDALTAYPWELLRDSDLFLFIDAQMCLGQPVRSPAGHPGDPPETDHPLRVLVVVGNDPEDDKIQADEELVAIEAAAHAKNDEVLLRALRRPLPEDIEEALLNFRPHVFHFIGHGVRPTAEVEPEIYVYGGATNQNDPWGADRIRSVFRQMPPRLVVLNACLTGDAPTASTSLVQAFLGAGCVAVIAMMGEIRGDASHAFSKRFYAELFAGRSVDVAVATARRAVRALATGQGNQVNVPALRSNWPLPRLTVSGDVGTAITMTRSANSGIRRWLKDDFVERWDERWRVWQSVDDKYSRFALINGQEEVGKSELLNTIAATYARHGETVVMVDLGGPSTGDTWRDVLRKIADTAETEGLVADRLKEIAKESGLSGPVIKKFQDELAKCIGFGSLLIVLDGLSDWEPNIVRETLLPELCGPYLLRTALPPVRMIITMREDCRDVWPALPVGWQPIMVGPFRLDEWERAMTHFEAHWKDRVPEAKREDFAELAKAYRKVGAKTGETLQLIRGAAKSLARS